jgi:hypothetical protein
MRRIALLLVVPALFVPSFLSAQRWNAEEQAVLDKVELCWTAWTESVNQKDLTPWLAECQPAEDVTAWNSTDGVLWDLEFQGREFNDWVRTVEHYRWQAIQPLDIKVYDDTAVIWFFVTLVVEDVNGNISRVQQRRFEFWRYYDGGWHWTAAMTASEEVGTPTRIK